jgi:CHAT domain-containing protein
MLAESVKAPELEQRAHVLRELSRLRRSSGDAVAGIAPSVLELQTDEGDVLARLSGQRVDIGVPAQESFLGMLEDRLVEFQHALARDGTADAELELRYLDAFGDSDSPLVAARLAVARGLLLYRQGRPAQAQREFKKAEQVLTRTGLLPELRQLKRYQTWCAARLGDARGVDQCRRDEAALLETLAASLAPDDQGLFWLNKWTADEEMLAAELEQLLSLDRRARDASWWRRPFHRARLSCALARFLTRLDEHREKRLHQALDLTYDPPRWRWPAWLRLVTYSRSRATFSFLVLPDRVFTGGVWQGGATVDVRRVSRLEVRGLVTQFHRSLVREGADEEATRALQTLGRVLGLDRLLARLPRRVRAVAFVADDALLGVPFTALPFGGDLVVSRWAVSHSVTWVPASRTRVATSALLVAAPEPGLGGERLEHAEREVAAVEQVCRRHGASVVRLGPKTASRHSVISGLHDASLWHAACHGRFEPQAPGLSEIVLQAVGERGPEVLTLADLAGLDLRRLRLAFLASCWSADNFVAPGRWVVSLPATLHVAGVQTVVGCAWEVPDQVAAEFSERFYEHVAAGAPCDEAHRQALLSCRREPDGRPRPLWDWTAFILVGEAGPIALRRVAATRT